MTEGETMSFADFARRLGVKPSYVNRLKADGRLVLADDGKRVLVGASEARIEASRDPAKAAVADRHAAARPPATLPAPEARPASTVEEGEEGSGYTYWRERNEKAKALASERENRIAEGELLDRAEVLSAIATAGAQVRTSLEALPYDLAAELAPITDEGRVRAVLVDRIEQTLTELSRQLGKATPEVTA